MALRGSPRNPRYAGGRPPLRVKPFCLAGSDAHVTEVRDTNGVIVHVGTRVRVLKIRPSVIGRLSEADAERVRSMQDEIFEVEEIDEWGGAWVTKWWREGSDYKALSHSLSLSHDEMEVVEKNAS